MYSPTSQRGFSLVELMIAMALGLLLTGVMVTVLTNANKTAAQDDRMGRMQENARYAMRVISQDLTMLDFWGGVIDGSLSADAITLNSDCGASGGAWAMTFTPTLEVLGDATASQAAAQYGCINDSDNAGEFKDNTDILAIKHVRGNPISTHSTSKAIFLRVSGTTGSMEKVIDTSNQPTTGETDWEYMTHIYYIRNYLESSGSNITSGAPYLYRKTLQATASSVTMGTEGGGVAEGIDNVIIQFGIDNTGSTGSPDGVADYYASRPTAAELNQAVTARIFVLARNTEADYAYANDKVYTLGDVILPVFNDNFYRRVFSTTVKLRNRINIKKLGN